MDQVPVSTSELKTYLRCRMLWRWTAPSPRGLYLEPKITPVQFSTGRATHRALQVYYDEGIPPDVTFLKIALEEQAAAKKNGAWGEELDRMKKDADTMLAVLRSYIPWADEADGQMDFIALEQPWQTEFQDLPYKGRYDAVVERYDGTWILDFKTTSYQATPWTSIDLQGLMYVAAAQELYGSSVQGIIYRFLRKKAPYTYEKLILKSGALTTRANLPDLTTLANYLQAIDIAVLHEMTEQPLEDCEALLATTDRTPEFEERVALAQRIYWSSLQALKGSGNSFLWDVIELKTDRQIHLHLKHLVIPSLREMYGLDKSWLGPTGLGNSYFSCRGCTFKGPCEALMSGGDYRMLLEDDYQVREPEDYELEE